MILMIRKRGLIKTVSIAAAVVVVVGIFAGSIMLKDKATSASADGNWGLSFQTEGAAPIANASAEYLKKYDGYYAEETDKKVLYLTFDAGYENGYTAKILDVLKKHKVPAAFFSCGKLHRVKS